MIPHLNQRLSEEAARDGVRFSETRHRCVMSVIDAPWSPATRTPRHRRGPAAWLAAAAAVALAGVLVHVRPAVGPPRPRLTLTTTDAAVPKDDAAARTVTVPDGVRDYARFFVEQLDNACSIGRHAAPTDTRPVARPA